MTKKQQIHVYLQTYSNLYTKAELYTKLVENFDVTRKAASDYYLEFQRTGIPKEELQTPCLNEIKTNTKTSTYESGQLRIETKIDFEVKSLEDLLLACDVDFNKWEVISWQCKKWDLGIKNAEEKIETKQLYSVSAKFRPKKVDEDLKLQKNILLKELFKNSEKVAINDISSQVTSNFYERQPAKDNLLEIALFDIHFGKLAHREEVGEDYDLKIACSRFKEAVVSLLTRTNTASIEKILLPIGQDLINVDNLQSTTTGGTPQDCDSRFHKIVKVVKQVLIETINDLSVIAPVDIVISVGNHDEQTTFMIGEMLDAYYHNSSTVKVYNDASLRKYYEYGITSIMFTHGNKEKFNELGMIFAAENPELWAKTKQRYIQIGHFHHNKKVSTLQAQEFQGFQVQILPSLSGTDAWHKGKGYQSLKQAKAFLYNKTKGLVGEFTYR